MAVYTYFIIGKLNPASANQDIQKTFTNYPVVEYSFFNPRRTSALIKLEGLFEPNEFTFKNFSNQTGEALYFQYVAQRACVTEDEKTAQKAALKL